MPAIKTVRDISRLSREQIRARPSITITGVVTYADGPFAMLFVQDDTAGVYVYGKVKPAEHRPGDLLEIEGTVTSGLYAPTVAATSVRLLGKRSLPRVPETPLFVVTSGSLDGQWIETRGIVQKEEELSNHLILELAGSASRCKVWVLDFDRGKVGQWVDAQIRLRGVVAPAFDRSNQLSGFQIFVSDAADIEILAQPVQDVFKGPVYPARDFARFRVRQNGGHRVRAQGTVTLSWPGIGLVLQDATGGLFAESDREQLPPVGSIVDVAGFLVPHDLYLLGNAEVHFLTNGPIPGPITLTAVHPYHSEWANRLVEATGRIVAAAVGVDGAGSLIVAVSNQVLTVRMPASEWALTTNNLRSGVQARLTGVLRNGSGRGIGDGSTELWLRQAGDIQILKPARLSVTRYVAIGSSMAVALLLALLVWMRWQNRLVTREIQSRKHALEQRFIETEFQLRQSLAERERISQDLHDDIIQSIYAVGLGLDETSRLADQQPGKVGERLRVAIERLNAVIREVRSFIGGMERRTIRGDELKTALKSVLLTSGWDDEPRVEIKVEPSAAGALTSVQATQMFNIAKEAMTNSVRHAQARLTTVSVVTLGRGVRLEVTDDGIGCNATAARAAKRGIHNMATRAQDIGGTFALESTPGRGVKVIVDVPIAT